MRIGSGRHTYEWVDGWAKIPDTESARTGWAHHGLVVSEAGNAIAFHQADPTVLVFDMEGNLERSWNVELGNAHGMSVVKEGDSEFLWLADNTSGRVIKTTLEGQAVLSLQRPEVPVYRGGQVLPDRRDGLPGEPGRQRRRVGDRRLWREVRSPVRQDRRLPG